MTAKKDYTKIEDFTKEEFLEIFRRADIFRKGGNFSDLAKGKVLATLFLKESVRTMATFQSAIVKLGGGWTGLSGLQGSYLASGEEDLNDTLQAFATTADCMVIRYNCNISDIAKTIDIPVISGMCGEDEHVCAALKMVYSLYNQFGGNTQGVNVGFYGMSSSSRPAKSTVKLLTSLGINVFEDSVIDELKFPQQIINSISGNQGKLITGKLADFLPTIDHLFILEGIPQKGENEKVIEKFNANFVPFTETYLQQMKPSAKFTSIMPRQLTNGTMTMDMDLDNNLHFYTNEELKNWVYVTMGLLTYILGIEI